MARNSAPNNNHIPAEVKKAKTKSNAACTGLREVITPSAESI